jgi:hypothetical protein
MPRHLKAADRIAAALLFAGAATGTHCPPASAQTPDQAAAAAALFDDAKAMMDKGNFAEACPKLAESEALDPQVGTMLNLALCYEFVGKTASGCSMWREAAGAAERKLQPERAELARERAAKVCSRAPRIAIDVAPQSGRDRVEVTVNDVRFPRDQWQTPQPYDPGEYQLRATGDGLRPWSSTVLVDEQHPAVVVVPVLAPASDPAAPAPAPPEGAGRGLLTAAWVTGGAGAAVLGLGSAFGIAAIVNDGAASSGRNCVHDICNPEGQSDRLRAIDDARVADVMFAIGAGALATGVVFWLVGSHVRSASTIYVQPAVAENRWALSFGEVW